MSEQLPDSLSMYKDDLRTLITTYSGQDRILTIPRTLVEYFDNIETALFFNQCIYWSDRATLQDRWFYKSYADWTSEIHLSEYQVRKVVKALKVRGCIESKVQKVGGNPTLHYRIIWDEFSVSFLKFLQEPTQSFSSNVSEESQGTLHTEPTTKLTTDIQVPLGMEVVPDWYMDLYAIRGFEVPFPKCQTWLTEKGISTQRADETAAAVKSKWPGPKSRPYTDPWATFRTWVQRPPVSRSTGGGPQRAADDRTEEERNVSWGR